MPELPEVETVRAGLAPFVEGASIEKVVLNRPDLRFPFPPDFANRLNGRTIMRAGRRAKYLLFELSDGTTWLSHLGMTGSYRFADGLVAEPTRYYASGAAGKHDHMELHLAHPSHGRLALVYTDARRFGFMDMFIDPAQSRWLRALDPEPLGNDFNADTLATRLREKKAPIKAALLDQSVVAGLGNIYVSEALFRAHILPMMPARDLVRPDGKPDPRLESLVAAVRAVLNEAILAGGSTLKDFRNADGDSGYFQHSFRVYDQEGAPCPSPGCQSTITRIVQSGRSSFFCPRCQY